MGRRIWNKDLLRLVGDSRLLGALAVDGLAGWLMSVPIDAADDVLHGLVRIGSPSGGDCVTAAWVVASALLPGASAVARRAGPGGDIDALVASQLWLEIREFPWWRHQKVAGNVLANIRAAAARDGALKRPSWAERRTVVTDVPPAQASVLERSAAGELADVLPLGGLAADWTPVAACPWRSLDQRSTRRGFGSQVILRSWFDLTRDASCIPDL